MATIKDIAQAVGVSHATVSNVLNHKGNVSAQKVKLVMDAANALGYHVNEAASALRSGGTRTIAVILPDSRSSAYSDLYQSLAQAAAEKGYGTLLCLTNNNPGSEHKAIAEVVSSRARYALVVTSLPRSRKGATRRCVRRAYACCSRCAARPKGSGMRGSIWRRPPARLPAACCRTARRASV